MDLSERTYKRVMPNTIHLSGLSVVLNGKEPKQVIYSSTTHGKNINVTNKNVDIDNIGQYSQLNISKCRSRYMIVTADYQECLKLNPNLLAFGTCWTEEDSAKLHHSSGKVVIMMCCLKPITKDMKWNDLIRKKIITCKPNILVVYDHHGSSGECYAFGNKPHYGMVEKSSISTYVNKRSKVARRTLRIECDADEIEEMCASQIAMALDNISKVIPEIQSLMSPVIDSAIDMQGKNESTVISNVKTTVLGFWNYMLYFNGTTSKLHRENDCAYTLVTVPKQIGAVTNKHMNKPMFMFKFNDTNTLMIPLTSGVSFVYNGQCVNHRQSCVRNDKNTINKFYNISSYANGKLFNHIRKTFTRLNINK